MLGIVPKLYEDELFYSWLCRYYVAKGFTSNSHFIEEVTGNNRLYLNKEFVLPFKAEFRHDIEKIFGFENVIRNHTLYGQEARFYTEEEINNVWELLQTDSFDIRTLFRMQKSNRTFWNMGKFSTTISDSPPLITIDNNFLSFFTG